MWFECDPFSDKKERLIFLVFTGEEPPKDARFIGTATFGQGGFIVVHCYVK